MLSEKNYQDAQLIASDEFRQARKDQDLVRLKLAENVHDALRGVDWAVESLEVKSTRFAENMARLASKLQNQGAAALVEGAGEVQSRGAEIDLLVGSLTAKKEQLGKAVYLYRSFYPAQD